MRYLYIVVLICLSCGSNEQAPEDIMTQDQMIEFLFDVNLINSSRGFISKSDNNYFMVRDTMLFRKHDIDCNKCLQKFSIKIEFNKYFIWIFRITSSK